MLATFLLVASAPGYVPYDVPGLRTGRAHSRVSSTSVSLWNDGERFVWRLSNGAPSEVNPENLLGATAARWTLDGFVLVLGDEQIPSSSLLKDGAVRNEAIDAVSSATGLAGRYAGRRIVVPLTDSKRRLHVTWSVELRDDSNAAVETIEVESLNGSVDVKRLSAFSCPASACRPVGTVPGSVVVGGSEDGPELFWGCEHPMARTAANETTVDVGLDRKIPLRQGVPWRVSFVVGDASPGQLRRSFGYFVERERAHPYRPFLHFNSWYVLGPSFGNPFDQEHCLDVIHKFGEELVEKRGVKMDSFLFDDGWDDTSTVWEFHKGFPDGFAPLKKEAEQYGADPGMWLSPWGGYGQSRSERLATGTREGMEEDGQGYALSGPKYFQRFREVCLRMVNEFGINQFKFDGTGNPNTYYPGSSFDSNFAAAIQLIGDLRMAKPDLFVNLTTGTWPSPFWLKYADSTWRGGYDHNFAGVGSQREKWITYRDGDTYKGVVQRGPLYPINSLMLHGLLYAHGAKPLDTDPDGEFRDEVRTYFSTGTQLQEMYIDPNLLTDQQWDWIAEAAKWSRANADVLRDVHWVGGDPNNLEVYGWGSWNGGKGILTLRNPSDKPQQFSIDVATVLQLPDSLNGSTWTGKSPWSDEASKPAVSLTAGKGTVVNLAPFQVMTLEMTKSP